MLTDRSWSSGNTTRSSTATTRNVRHLGKKENHIHLNHCDFVRLHLAGPDVAAPWVQAYETVNSYLVVRRTETGRFKARTIAYGHPEGLIP